jgi:predicted lipoprotein with Yx(FWY)xxD motif
MLKSIGRPVLLALSLSVAVASGAYALVPTKMAETTKGKVLVDDKGMTLYTFDKDADGKSNCKGPCAANWPALRAEAGAEATAPYTVIVREDGSKQWAYSGKPLYTFAKDTKAGDTMGDGFLNGAWHIAKP